MNKHDLDTEHGPQWKQSVNSTLADHDQDITKLQNQWIEHLTKCHPEIVKSQQAADKRTAALEYRYMLLAAFGIGMGMAFGWGLRELLDFLRSAF